MGDVIKMSSALDSGDDTAALMCRLKPVWTNTYWIKNALDLCEGIWQHGAEIRPRHHHFFAVVQEFALRSAVLDTCKLYDHSNRRFAKDTIPALLQYAKDHFTDTYFCRVDEKQFLNLGVCVEDARLIVHGFKARSDYSATKDRLFALLEPVLPACATNSTLQKLFLVRDKVIAHQEQLTDAVRGLVKYLPPLDEMEKLNAWSMSFCEFTACLLSNESFLPHPVSARMAALHVVAKILGKDFESGGCYSEGEDFFKKSEWW
jgi:hypothetical protein